MKFERLEDMNIVRVHANAVHVQSGGTATSDPMFMIFDPKYPTDDMGLIWNEASKYFEHLFSSKEVPNFKPVSIKSLDVLGSQGYIWIQKPRPDPNKACLTTIQCKATYRDEHIRNERLDGGLRYFTVPGSFLTVNDVIKNVYIMKKVLGDYYGAQEPAIEITGIVNLYIAGRGMLIR